MSKNFIFLTGNLGNDVEVKTVGEDKKVCNFSIAESVPTNKRDDKGQRIYKTRWHNITAWGFEAQKMEASIKGQIVDVVGILDYEEEKIGDRTIRHARIVAEKIDLYAIFNTAAVREAKNPNRKKPEEAWAN